MVHVNGSINISKFVVKFCFQFQVMPLKAFDDYITLHNLSMLLTYIVTATRDVVIVSYSVLINVNCVILS